MWNIIAAVLVTLLSFIGFVACIRGIIFRLYKPKGEQSVLLVSTDENSCEDIEYSIRSWATRISWMGKAAPDRIIIVDSSLDRESKEICRRICDEYSFIQIADINDLKEIFNKKNT